MKLERNCNTNEEPLGIFEAVCIKCLIRDWRDTTLHRNVRRKHISRKEKMLFCEEGVRGVHGTENIADNKTAIR